MPSRSRGGSWQYSDEIINLALTGAQVVDGDDGADLAEYLGALLRREFYRLLADKEFGHEILQQVLDPLPARS